jgi:hypothetical protein
MNPLSFIGLCMIYSENRLPLFGIMHYRIIAEVDCSIWSVALITFAFIS